MSKNHKPSARAAAHSAIRDPQPAFDCIRLRGVRQNNLKGFDLDIPLGKYIAVTGLSGAGKSSLVFDTLHAEGQRRYVETFSAYTRQFLDLLDKPKVDSIENIRPSIAIEQTNTVKTSRSTVGTMTELTDYFKVWFSHVARCYDPETGELVEADTPQTIWTKTLAAAPKQTLVVTFRIQKPASLAWPEILTSLKNQSYVRVLLPYNTDKCGMRIAECGMKKTQPKADKTTLPKSGHSEIRIPKSTFTTHRVDDLLADPAQIPAATTAIHVVQDRIEITDANRSRFLEAAEAALHFGHGQLQLFVARASSPCSENPKSQINPEIPNPKIPKQTTTPPLASDIPHSEIRIPHSALRIPHSAHSAFYILHSSFSSTLHNPATNRTFRPATPALFSFNSPLGACPRCRGFGRVIEIDYRLAIPDQTLSIEDGAIKAFEGQVYSMSREDLIRAARRHKIPTGIPYSQLTEKQREFVMLGEPEYRARKARGEEIDYDIDDLWYGLKGFFQWLENTTYKMHVRVFLSRYRAYNPCPACRGQRLQPEALCWKWNGRTLPELYTLPVSKLLARLETDSIDTTQKNPKSQNPKPVCVHLSACTCLRATHRQNAQAERTGISQTNPEIPNPKISKQTIPEQTTTPPLASDHSAFRTLHSAFSSILTRLRYLAQVGLGYLTLDRPSKTLSGGEVERVNLTSCLGTSLVDTLFVLDEPSVGLHPRDIDRLIAIIRSLTDAGNTVVVVEHDETMIRAADHIIEVGPEPGARGGHIVFTGPLQNLLSHPTSITGRYLSGRDTIPLPQSRRPIAPHQPDPSDQPDPSAPSNQSPRSDRPKHSAFRTPHSAFPPPHSAFRTPHSAFPPLRIERATKHNITNLTLSLPLNRLVCISGVSGSGKSTLLDNIIYQGLLTARHQLAEDPAAIARITGAEAIGEVILVDQSPLSRTPRSNPALYTEAWEHIRELYADTPAAQTAGLTPSSFSFNSGDGRCDHCNGLGSERVEMQFLSDVYVPCPICEGRRFKPEVLAITCLGLSISELLNTPIDDALVLFAGHPQIATRLAPLAQVGLGYLTLGQPLNTLSGGESQRLKLIRHLADTTATLTSSPPSALSDPSLPSARSDPSAQSAQSYPSDPSHQSDQSDQPDPSEHSAFRIPHSAFKGALLLLDEPTTGLHRHDIKRLLSVLHALVDRGHSVIVIEHNTDILKSADWIIEIGPEAGAAGGRIVAEGPPEHIATTDTATAPYLLAALANPKSQNPKPQINPKIPNPKIPKQTTTPPLASDIPHSEIRIPHSAHSAHSAIRIPQSALQITGARENNLKNITLSIPHHALNVVTGVSGSGKSTLAFDIVFAEGQRRFMESMSPYARQFVEQLPRPDIDLLTGIPPTVAIEQRITRGSRKSTVATITEVAQYLRLLYARLGVQHHPDTGHPVEPLTPAQLRTHLAKILSTDPRAKKAKKLYLCAPLIRGRKGHHQPIATWIEKQGYTHMRADGRLFPIARFEKLDRYKEHDIEVIVADLKSSTGFQPVGLKSNTGFQPVTTTRNTAPPANRNLKTTQKKFQTLDEALKLGRGSCFLLTGDNEILTWLSTTRTDSETGETFPELDPKNFSFNSPRGWCPACRGHGRIYPWMLDLDNAQNDTIENRDISTQLRPYGIDDAADISDHGQPCPQCHGDRLNRTARAVRLHFVARASSPCDGEAAFRRSTGFQPVSGKPIRHRLEADATHRLEARATKPTLSLPALLRLTPSALLAQLRRLDQTDPRTRAITQDILPQIEERLRFLDHVGLGYLTLDRPTETLSGGESQRIRLAAQLGSNLSGVLYVLDEPSIGLHARDNDRLIETLKTLRAKGNTLLVVEHDDELMRQADRIIDLGPAAGIHGGELLANDTPAALIKNAASLTGLFLEKGIKHPLRGAYRPLPPS